MKLFYLIPCFLAMLSCIVCSPNPLSCNNLCATPMNWAPPSLGLCGQNGKNYYNHLCDSAFKSFGMCLINSKFIISNVGISYPGDCGCPNYCYNTTMQGNCTGTCQCESGWTGADCSQLTMENTCSGHGSVVDIAGILNCNCNGEYALSDCSASVVSLPPIIQTISPAQQYSSWDDYGNNNPIFNESTIAVMHLTMAPSDFAFLLNPANIESDTYVNASMWFDNGATFQTMNNIGIRLQGGASRGYVKKSWKLKFDEFEDQKWAQQKKLGVKSLEQDPSGIKGSLCFSLLYSLNLPAQRASYAQVFINGQGMGGFIMEEAIDDQFLKSRFGNDDGALFKCSSPLAYLGSDPQLYNTSEIVPKTDLADTKIGFSLIRDLIFIINATTDEEFASALPTVLDVDSYTRSLAFEVLTGNWDGLWNSNNYYLYWNPEVGVFQYIRHDMDMTFGAVEPYYPMKTAPVYTWGDGGSGYRLINRVLAVQPFRQMFTDYCYQLIDAYYKLEGEYVQRMEALNRQIAPLMKRDNWRTTDFGWTFSEFEEMPDKGLTRPPGGFFEKHNFEDIHFMGLKEFMEARIQSALQQLDPPSK